MPLHCGRSFTVTDTLDATHCWDPAMLSTQVAVIQVRTVSTPQGSRTLVASSAPHVPLPLGRQRGHSPPPAPAGDPRSVAPKGRLAHDC